MPPNPSSGTRHLSRFLSAERLTNVRAAVKAEIELACKGQPPKTRLFHILQELGKLTNKDDKDDRLRCYIFAMSALVHHEKHGGLDSAKVDHLCELIYALLQSFKAKPDHGTNTKLYSDLHIVRSQIFRRDGAHLRAGWEQKMIEHIAHNGVNGGQEFNLLAAASRVQRLGDTGLAIKYLKLAAQSNLDPERMSRVHLEILRALRFIGESVAAHSYEEKVSALKEFSEDIKKEFVWERILRDIQRTGNLTAITDAVKPNGPFYLGDFLVEASVWAKIPKERQWLEKIPKIVNLVRRKDLEFAERDFLFRFAKTLDDCYDYDIPLTLRLKAVGDIVCQRDRLLTVEWELIVLAAAARFLQRSRMHDMTCFVLQEYRTLCHRLSVGKNTDILGLLNDLFENPLYGNEQVQITGSDISIPMFAKKSA